MVGQKVAAALSGTFLGIFLAYGVGVPITQLITLNQTQEFLYYHIVQRSVSGLLPVCLRSWLWKSVGVLSTS